MQFLNMGPGELLLIMVIALIVFGPGKLPEIGAAVGRSLREFRRATSEITSEFTREVDDLKTQTGIDVLTGEQKPAEQNPEVAKKPAAAPEGTSAAPEPAVATPVEDTIVKPEPRVPTFDASYFAPAAVAESTGEETGKAELPATEDSLAQAVSPGEPEQKDSVEVATAPDVPEQQTAPPVGQHGVAAPQGTLSEQEEETARV